MLVMVTGGTGFIGSHTAKALIDANHRVKLLVRSEEKAKRVYSDLHCPLPQLIKGDMTDPASVSLCMEDCDAVFHSAALVTMDSTKGEKMLNDNRLGTEIVLNRACEKKIRSIVYVSSIATIFTPGQGFLEPDAPMSLSQSAYSRSKIEAEKIARSLIAKGFPIKICNPTAVIGPDDPALSEANYAIKTFMRIGIPATSSGFQFIDVRDLAQINLRLIERDAGAGVFLAGGLYRPWNELGDMLAKITGRPVRHYPVPGFMLRAFGRIFDAIQKIKSINLPYSQEAMRYATQWRPVDDSKTLQILGFSYRDQETTLRDTITWLYRNGRLEAKHAGIIADTRA